MNLFLKLKLVLILDNMNNHLSKDLIIIYKKAGVYLEYLFLYLFNYNLIEESFFTLKA